MYMEEKDACFLRLHERALTLKKPWLNEEMWRDFVFNKIIPDTCSWICHTFTYMKYLKARPSFSSKIMGTFEQTM